MANSMSRRDRFSVSTTARVALTLAVVAGSLVACDREPQSAKALREQGDKLEVLGTGGSAGPTQAQANTFKETTTKLSGLGQGKVASAAMTLVSSAQTGLADDQIATLEDKEAAAVAKIGEIQGTLAVYSGASSVAVVAESYDPSADLTDAAKSKGDREKTAQETRARLATLDAQIADLRAQIKNKNDAADAKMLEFNEAMARTNSLKATEALPIVEAANKAKRAADALKLEAGKIEAQLDVTTPLANELRLFVEQAVNQAKSLDDRAAELNAKKAASVRLAAAAREESVKAKDELKRQVSELDALRSGEVESAGQSSLNTLSQAVKAAQSASSDVPGGAKLALGTAKQKIGDVQATRARGHQAYASLMKGLAKADPKLPDASDYAAKAEAATKAGEDAITAARTAYGEAGSAFNSVPVTGDVKQRLQALAAKLQAMSKSAEEQAADAAAQAQANPAPAAPATDAPAAPAASVDPKILSTLDAFYSAMRDEKWDDIPPLVFESTPQTRANVRAVLPLTAAFAKLDAAAKSKFGTGFAAMAAMANPGASFDFEKIKSLTSKDFKITVEGETATARSDANPNPTTLKKSGDGWLVVLDMVDSPMIAQALPMAPVMTQTMNEIAADILSGKIPDMNTAMLTLQQKMMGGMKPPGGG